MRIKFLGIYRCENNYVYALSSIIYLSGSGTLNGWIPFITQTASTTNLTVGFGFFIVLTTVTSAGLRVSNERTAD